MFGHSYSYPELIIAFGQGQNDLWVLSIATENPTYEQFSLLSILALAVFQYHSPPLTPIMTVTTVCSDELSHDSAHCYAWESANNYNYCGGEIKPDASFAPS